MDKLFTIDQSKADEFSFNEIIGAIFVRSQVIEQLMREMLEQCDTYTVPNDFGKKTFGSLLIDFRREFSSVTAPKDAAYPNMSIYQGLVDTRDIRNDAAHGYFLAGLSIFDLIDDYGSKADTEQFITRGLRKSLMAVDYCLVDFLEYCRENGWKPADLKSNNVPR